MAFYEGIDEEIYEGGDHYMPMQQFRLNQNYRPTTVTPDVVPTSTSYGIPTLYPYENMGGGGDNSGGWGLFGNLDRSTEKEFNIDGEEVTGYKNVNTGLYQDFEGKNIQNLGLRNIPGITGMVEKVFGESDDPDYPGLFDKVSLKALRKNPALFKSFFDRQDVEKQQKIQNEIDQANKTAGMAAHNAQTYGTGDATGGYQSSFGGDKDFMGGSGTAADMGSFAYGGLARLL